MDNVDYAYNDHEKGTRRWDTDNFKYSFYTMDENEAQADCEMKTDCLGYWERVGKENWGFSLLFSGSRTYRGGGENGGLPNHTVRKVVKKVRDVVIKVEVSVKTNPADIAWTLQDECNGHKVVFDRKKYPNDRGATYENEMCLPLGKYNYTITDLEGDGGDSYKVFQNGKEVANGGAEHFSASDTFGCCD